MKNFNLFAIILFISLSACSELPPGELPTSTPSTQPSAPTTSPQDLTTLTRLVIPPNTPYNDALAGLSISTKPLLISHICNTSPSTRQYLTPGAQAPAAGPAIAAWFGGGGQGVAGMSEEELKWMVVEALMYCEKSEFYYGNGVDTRGGGIVIDEALWERVGGGK